MIGQSGGHLQCVENTYSWTHLRVESGESLGCLRLLLWAWENRSDLEERLLIP